MMRKILQSLIVLACFAGAVSSAQASTGSIDAVNHFAWDNNGGWVNWGASNSSVSVSSSVLTGYIWTANFGWINLNPANGGVTNNGNGVLGGWAWGENTGWINFSGVTIDSNGVFHGSTEPQNIFGTMTFDCTHCNVTTGWRAAVSNSSGVGSNVGGGSFSSGTFGPAIVPVVLLASSTSIGTPPQNNPIAQSVLPPALVPTTKPVKIKPMTPHPKSATKPSYTNQRVTSKFVAASTTSATSVTLLTNSNVPPVAQVNLPKKITVAAVRLVSQAWYATVTFFESWFK